MAPRWIASALDAACDGARHLLTDVRKEAVATALIERLPLEAMAEHACKALVQNGHAWEASRAAIYGVVYALTDGDPEVVQLTELYQAVSKALDDAGVPYGTNTAALLDTAARVRWLAQQRPTRLELQRVEAERDAARAEHADASAAFAESIADTSIERDRLAAERDRARADADQLSASAADDYVRLLADYEGLKGQLAKANELNGKLAAGGAELQAERDRWRGRGKELYSENEQLREEARDALAQRDAARLQSAEYLGQRDRARADIEERDGTIAALRQQSTKQATRIGDLSTRKVTKPRGKKAVRR